MKSKFSITLQKLATLLQDYLVTSLSLSEKIQHIISLSPTFHFKNILHRLFEVKHPNLFSLVPATAPQKNFIIAALLKAMGATSSNLKRDLERLNSIIQTTDDFTTKEKETIKEQIHRYIQIALLIDRIHSPKEYLDDEILEQLFELHLN